MEANDLIGKKVYDTLLSRRGVIKAISEDKVRISWALGEYVLRYPDAFAHRLLLKNQNIQERIKKICAVSDFESFKKKYTKAITDEIQYLKRTGGKRYSLLDGELISKNQDFYIYSFETDTELHFPDDVPIKIWSDTPQYGTVISCEDFSIIFSTSVPLGKKIEKIEISVEPWQLMEGLIERINEIEPDPESIPYKLACCGQDLIDEKSGIVFGQNEACERAVSEPIVFVWGPPGTGKTQTLAKIAHGYLERGERVLMVSHSNVSVDGALLRVANMREFQKGEIIRYGYPRDRELLESEYLTSYKFVLNNNERLKIEHELLLNKRKELAKKDPERRWIDSRLKKIRKELLDKEKELIHQSGFVATTISKAIIDASIYRQSFDAVIFDEASMAYIPQIIFAGSIASRHFICMGDFNQLPAIVQNPEDDVLNEDIFEYTGVTRAVNHEHGHQWLVMLNKQYRSHPAIADFVSKEMYGGLIMTGNANRDTNEEIAKIHPFSGRAMAIANLSGFYSVCIKCSNGSRINLLSAMICMRIAEIASRESAVGIISPYNAQARLVLAMIRDYQDNSGRTSNITSATVHQFQGSEKAIIIYDAVDCFRMPYPSGMLTSTKNNQANRLFNVAVTRARGKFVLVANMDYMRRKKISKHLLFSKAMKMLEIKGDSLTGTDLLEEIDITSNKENFISIHDRNDSWEEYIKDIISAKERIHIDIPGIIIEDETLFERMEQALSIAEKNGVNIVIRVDADVCIPEGWEQYVEYANYVTNPITIIDNYKVWFGQPIYDASFISEGEILETQAFPVVKICGYHTARILRNFLNF